MSQYNGDKRHLFLVHGGMSSPAPIEGPISRLGLRRRVEPVSARVIAFVIFAKAALLASVLYYLFG